MQSEPLIVKGDESHSNIKKKSFLAKVFPCFSCDDETNDNSIQTHTHEEKNSSDLNLITIPEDNLHLYVEANTIIFIKYKKKTGILKRYTSLVFKLRFSKKFRNTFPDESIMKKRKKLDNQIFK